eukprot:257259-Rhodomonas_salina.1
MDGRAAGEIARNTEKESAIDLQQPTTRERKKRTKEEKKEKWRGRPFDSDPAASGLALGHEHRARRPLPDLVTPCSVC